MTMAMVMVMSRCVVSRKGVAVEMSTDHKPEDEPELARIQKAGGAVMDGRVQVTFDFGEIHARGAWGERGDRGFGWVGGKDGGCVGGKEKARIGGEGGWHVFSHTPPLVYKHILRSTSLNRCIMYKVHSLPGIFKYSMYSIYMLTLWLFLSTMSCLSSVLLCKPCRPSCSREVLLRFPLHICAGGSRLVS